MYGISACPSQMQVLHCAVIGVLSACTKMITYVWSVLEWCTICYCICFSVSFTVCLSVILVQYSTCRHSLSSVCCSCQLPVFEQQITYSTVQYASSVFAICFLFQCRTNRRWHVEQYRIVQYTAVQCSAVHRSPRLDNHKQVWIDKQLWGVEEKQLL